MTEWYLSDSEIFVCKFYLENLNFERVEIRNYEFDC